MTCQHSPALFGFSVTCLILGMIPRIPLSITSAALALLLGAPLTATAQTILSTDFGKSEIKSYGNGKTIGSGSGSVDELTVNTGTYFGESGQWKIDPASDLAQVKIEEVNGKRVLALISGAVSKRITKEISDSDSLRLKGSIIFTPQATPNGSGDLLILLTEGNWFSTGRATVASLLLSPNLVMKYPGGKVPEKLNEGVRYQIDFTVDLTAQPHTWEFTLSEAGDTPSPIFSSGPLPTRSEKAPNMMVVRQSGGGEAPLVEIEKLSLLLPGFGE